MTKPLKCPTCGHEEPGFGGGMFVAFLFMGVLTLGWLIGRYWH